MAERQGFSKACYRNYLNYHELRNNPLFYTNLGIFVCLSLLLCSCVRFGRLWTQVGHKIEAVIPKSG
jgi:hypothetical protein